MTMRDYSELVKALRACGDHFDCENCPIDKPESTSDDCHKVDLDAADAIEELVAERDQFRGQAKMVPQWISVEERLPDDQCDDARAARGGDYIHKVLAVSVTPNYTAMDTAYLYNGRWALGQYTSWKHFMGAPVTHWMPLPDPPKEVE